MPAVARALQCPVVQSLEPRILAAKLHHAIAAATALPRPDHVVIVVEENKDYRDVLGAGLVPPSLWSVIPPSTFQNAPYIRSLAKRAANFTNAHGEFHPSEPNYLELFSGSNQGITSDAVPPQPFTAPSLGGELINAGFTFAGYSESLPSRGSVAVKSGEYARKHNPWSDFADVPASSNLPFSDFPSDYSKLPTVSFVVPNQANDMHSGSIRRADRWLKSHVGPYANWVQTHNSLLIVTWDEGRGTNHIPTIMTGQMIKRGKYAQRTNHLNILATIESMYGLAPLGGSAGAAAPIIAPFAATTTTSALQPASIFSTTSIAPQMNILSAWSQLSDVLGPGRVT